MFRVDRSEHQNRPLTPPPGQAGAGRNAGQLPPGAHAMQPGQLSSLSDMAEELSLHVADRTEKKVHAERKVKADHQVEPMPAPLVQELIGHHKDPLAQQKLEALVNLLQSKQHSPASLRAELALAFQDVSHQFLAAHFVLGHAMQDGGSPELAAALQEVIAELENEQGKEIRAGINSAPTLGAAARDAEQAQHLTDTYRQFALHEQGLSQTLTLSLQAFGSLNAKDSLTLMIAALSDDLNAPRPSTERQLLASVSASLYQVQAAVTVLYACNDLAQGWHKRGYTGADGAQLMLDLAALTERRNTSRREISSLPEKHGMTELKPRLAFHAGILGIVGDLSPSIFQDSNARDSCMTSIREAITELAEEEDRQCPG